STSRSRRWSSAPRACERPRHARAGPPRPRRRRSRGGRVRYARPPPRPARRPGPRPGAPADQPDSQAQGVSDAEWAAATASCFALRVAHVIDETHDTRSFVLEVPPELEARFRYRAGQFLSFKVPLGGKVLTRSYSLSSSPECDREHKVTV